jgi:hypothetical protein
MPSETPDGFDWLESPVFARLVEMQVVDTARRSDLERVDDDAIARVTGWLAENRAGAREDERQRPVSQQRGPHDALASIDRLVRLAAEAALSSGRRTLRESDLVGVYDRHPCGFWPVCKLRRSGGGTADESTTVIVGGPGDLLALRILDMARGRVPA